MNRSAVDDLRAAIDRHPIVGGGNAPADIHAPLVKAVLELARRIEELEGSRL